MKGTKENPYTHAPEDWHEDGVPYGAWCVCAACGYLGRSTMTFDYYAKHVGDPLVCERCFIGTSQMVDMKVGRPMADVDNDIDGGVGLN